MYTRVCFLYMYVEACLPVRHLARPEVNFDYLSLFLSNFLFRESLSLNVNLAILASWFGPGDPGACPVLGREACAPRPGFLPEYCGSELGSPRLCRDCFTH